MTESSVSRGRKCRFGAKTAHTLFVHKPNENGSRSLKTNYRLLQSGRGGRKTNTERPILHFHDVALSVYVSHTFIRKPTRQPLTRAKQPDGLYRTSVSRMFRNGIKNIGMENKIGCLRRRFSMFVRTFL